MVANSEKFRPTILAFLKSSPIPLTATELCSRLRVKAVKLAEYEVLRELRPLREEGLVRLERGRWSAVSRVAVASSLDSVPLKLDESDALRTPSVPASPVSATATIEWSPIKSPILNGTPRSNKQTSPAVKPADFSGPWSTFRKLLGYYADCVRNDEGCEASGFLQDCGERFIFLSLLGTWYPKAAQPWRLSLPSGPHLQSLIRKLTLAGQDGVLVLGYPFQVFTRPEGEGAEGVFVKPIFTYQLAWHVRADGLEIWSDDSWAEVNLDWLTYALKKPDQQRMFLSACGLMDRGRSDESFGDGSRLSYAPDLRTLAAGVTTFFGERTREPLRPENVSSVPLPTRPESGIYSDH